MNSFELPPSILISLRKDCSGILWRAVFSASKPNLARAWAVRLPGFYIQMTIKRTDEHCSLLSFSLWREQNDESPFPWTSPHSPLFSPTRIKRKLWGALTPPIFQLFPVSSFSLRNIKSPSMNKAVARFKTWPQRTYDCCSVLFHSLKGPGGCSWALFPSVFLSSFPMRMKKTRFGLNEFWPPLLSSPL